MLRPHRSTLLFFLSIALLPVATTAATAIKKWVDANGVTHYGTSVPPEYIDKPYSQLNERGMTVKRIGRAKTDEEIAREKELEELRRAQQQAIAEQRAKDRVLLNMFRTEDDLVMSRDGKLAQVDAQIRLKKAHVDRLKGRLAKWQAAAAARERQGKKPTAKQLENLRELEQQLESTYVNIVEKEATKNRISQQYAYELQRFTQLKGGFRASSTEDIQAPHRERKVIEVAGAYVCSDSAECDHLWGYAKRWAEQHSGTPIEVVGDRILVTKAPQSREKISLSVSRLSKGDIERIFLDINCHKSVAGKELCATDRVESLRDRFVADMKTYAAKPEEESALEQPSAENEPVGVPVLQTRTAEAGALEVVQTPLDESGQQIGAGLRFDTQGSILAHRALAQYLAQL